MSLDPVRYSLTAWRGATFSRRITWLSGGVGSTPTDLTGFTGVLTIKAHPTDVSPLFTMSTTNGRIILGGTAGTVDLLISAADTPSLTWSGACYELLLTSPTGVATMLTYGAFKVQGF